MILSMYARGMSTRDIQAHLEEIYRVEVSSASSASQQFEATTREVRRKLRLFNGADQSGDLEIAASCW